MLADLRVEEATVLASKGKQQGAYYLAGFGVVKDWDVESRYEAKGLNGRDMLRAVSSPYGVLQWIKQHW